MCLLRINDSIDTLEKRAGADGYFDFIIEATANQTGASISELENGIDEITNFVGQISGISAQTNLLL